MALFVRDGSLQRHVTVVDLDPHVILANRRIGLQAMFDAVPERVVGRFALRGLQLGSGDEH